MPILGPGDSPAWRRLFVVFSHRVNEHMKVLLYQLDAMSRRLLTSVMQERGYLLASAANRQEAWSAIATEPIEAMVVDFEGDGYDLVRAIRTKERADGTHTPVIALVVGDTLANRQRCAEAGADAVLSAPVRKSELSDVLDQTMAKDGSSSASRVAGSAVPAALDFEAALERVEGDRALLEELLRLFLDECKTTVRQIRESWSAGDFSLVGRLAHTLKGSSANVGATAVSDAAFTLEQLARSGAPKIAEDHVAKLEKELARLIPELDSLLKHATR